MNSILNVLAQHADATRRALFGATVTIVGGSAYWIVGRAKGTNAVRAWLRDLDSGARSVAAKDLRKGLQTLLQDGVESNTDEGLERVWAALDQHRLTSNRHEWRVGCIRAALYSCVAMAVMVAGAWSTHWLTDSYSHLETAFLVGWLIAATTYSLRAFLPLFGLALRNGEPKKEAPAPGPTQNGVVEQSEAAMAAVEPGSK